MSLDWAEADRIGAKVLAARPAAAAGCHLLVGEHSLYKNISKELAGHFKRVVCPRAAALARRCFSRLLRSGATPPYVPSGLLMVSSCKVVRVSNTGGPGTLGASYTRISVRAGAPRFLMRLLKRKLRPGSLSHNCMQSDRDLGLMASFGSPVPRRARPGTCAAFPFLCAPNPCGVLRDRHTRACQLGLRICCDQGLGCSSPALRLTDCFPAGGRVHNAYACFFFRRLDVVRT